MISFIARFLGIWLIAGALVAIVIDATKSIAASSLTVTQLGIAWANVNLPSLMSAQQFVQQSIEPYTGRWLWDPVIQSLLMLPTWAVLGALGFLLTWAGQRRRMKLSYA